jgi:hypothetical protein
MAKKSCNRCGIELDLSVGFSENPNSSDGYRSICKGCDGEYARKRYVENKERLRREARIYSSSDAGKKARRKYLETDIGRMNHRESARRHKLKNPLKERARVQIKLSLISGLMVRPDTCEACSTDCKPDGHHHDYNKPLEVIWLCKGCHIGIHTANRRMIENY